jgi:predicted amidophosphoribosyltransferase
MALQFEVFSPQTIPLRTNCRLHRRLNQSSNLLRRLKTAYDSPLHRPDTLLWPPTRRRRSTLLTQHDMVSRSYARRHPRWRYRVWR